MRRAKQLALAVTLTLGLALSACSSSADSASNGPDESDVTWPEPGKTIQIYVGFGPGGVTDTLTRDIASVLEEKTGSRVQVVNREGAGTQLALAAMLNEAPDGYTMSQISMPAMLGYIWNGQGAPFELEDFKPIANVGLAPNGLVVRADSPYQTLGDLIDAAQTKTLNAGDNGGADDAMVLGALQEQGGVEFNRVVFDAGSEKVRALLSGDIEFYPGAVGGVLPQLESGEFRILAQWTEEPTALTQDIPTALEQGYDIVTHSYHGFAFSADVPDAIRDAAEEAFREVSEDQGLIDKLGQGMIATEFLTGSEFGEAWNVQKELITEATERYGPES